MRNTADVTAGEPIASDVNDVCSTVAFYDIHGRNGEVLFFYFVPVTTGDERELIIRNFSKFLHLHSFPHATICCQVRNLTFSLSERVF
jgi:hypothetical protein